MRTILLTIIFVLPLCNIANAEWIKFGKTSEGDDFQYNDKKVIKSGEKMYFSIRTGEGKDILVSLNCNTSTYMFKVLDKWSV
jgi:hypothetical protein